MHQLGPAGIPYPQGAAANSAETSLARAFTCFPGLFIPDPGVKDGDIFFATQLVRLEVCPDVDGTSATSCGFPAYGSIAEVEWVRMR